MRGYHIYITVNRKTELSISHPQAADTFVPTAIFQHLPAQVPKSTVRQNALFNSDHKDHRLGPIRIDWVDLEYTGMSKVTYTSSGKEKAQKGQATARFIPNTRTKSGSTNLPEGIVHIFRENDTRPSDAGASTSVSRLEVPLSEESDGVTLAVLAVPSWMTPSDFLTFVAPAAEGMAHLRMIRDSAPNRSIVLINFHKSTDAAEFIEAYNGKPFNSMDPETCHVVRILSVHIEPEDSVSLAISRLSPLQGSTYELPTCPVCLERMDSAVTGLVTVPCSHTFHCMCLSKWGDSRCPVCRYSQTLLSSYPASANSSRPIPFAASSSPSLSVCANCSSTTNLWICLICGNIGCGRYGRAHAQAHYQSTTHLYALELETQRVWDYAGDGYVHRLIQNKADGKLVELPSASMSSGATRENNESGLGPGLADRLNAEKIEAIGIEYSYLLTSQLDSQRSYYEEQTCELNHQIGELKGFVERLSRELDTERARAKEEHERHKREQEAKVLEFEREKMKAEKRAEKMTELARRLDKELREERAVGEGLLKNLGTIKERVEQSEKEKNGFNTKIKDLEDQMRDLMFYLDARTKIEGEGEASEAAGGSIELPLNTQNSKKKGRK